MLVSLKEILNDISGKTVAVPAFNVYGYEDAAAIVEAAEEKRAPVILATNRDAINHMPVDILGGILRNIGENSSTKVCIHLDHGKTYEEAVSAIKSGYTSVMFDGSALSLNQNIEMTKEVVKLARAAKVSVEAEIGSVGYADDGKDGEYTKLSEAIKFFSETKVDALAVAVGTVHRMKSQVAKIDFELLQEIQDNIDVPLVIHGSSGVKNEDLKNLINYRVGKINIGTAIRMKFGGTLRDEIEKNHSEFDRIKLFKEPMKAVKEEAIEKFNLLGF